MTFPVMAEDPTGRTVEVRDPTADDAPEPYTGWEKEINVPREEWQAFYHLCAVHARLQANAEEVRALMAEQDPERKADAVARAIMCRENARSWRESAERYARMAED